MKLAEHHHAPQEQNLFGIKDHISSVLLRYLHVQYKEEFREFREFREMRLTLKTNPVWKYVKTTPSLSQAIKFNTIWKIKMSKKLFYWPLSMRKMVLLMSGNMEYTSTVKHHAFLPFFLIQKI